jgi:hypothetical protein
MLIINIGGVWTKPPRVAGIIKIQPTQKLNSSCAYAKAVKLGRKMCVIKWEPIRLHLINTFFKREPIQLYLIKYFFQMETNSARRVRAQEPILYQPFGQRGITLIYNIFYHNLIIAVYITPII